jgi:hypothetical protein
MKRKRMKRKRMKRKKMKMKKKMMNQLTKKKQTTTLKQKRKQKKKKKKKRRKSNDERFPLLWPVIDFVKFSTNFHWFSVCNDVLPSLLLVSVVGISY